MPGPPATGGRVVPDAGGRVPLLVPPRDAVGDEEDVDDEGEREVAGLAVAASKKSSPE